VINSQEAWQGIDFTKKNGFADIILQVFKWHGGQQVDARHCNLTGWGSNPNHCRNLCRDFCFTSTSSASSPTLLWRIPYTVGGKMRQRGRGLAICLCMPRLRKWSHWHCMPIACLRNYSSPSEGVCFGSSIVSISNYTNMYTAWVA